MRRISIVVAVLIIVVVIGLLMSRSGRGTSSGLPATATLAQRSDTLESSSGHLAVAVDDIEAARTAAVEAVALTGEVVDAGLISRRDLVESIATPDYGPVLADETSLAVEAMLTELGARHVDRAGMRVSEFPLTAAATPEAGDVRVRVWSVLVIAAPGVGPGRQVWRTVNVLMKSVAGRWLVADWVSTFGPTPAPAVEVGFDDPAALGAPMSWPSALVARDMVGVG